MVVIIVLMSLISLFIFRFFIRIWAYGNESRFFVIGKWTPGLFGLLFAIGFMFADIPIYLPIGLFLFCCLWLYLNLTPMLEVNGNEIRVMSRRKGSKVFNKADVKFENGKVYIGEQIIHKSSLNYNQLVEWIEN